VRVSTWTEHRTLRPSRVDYGRVDAVEPERFELMVSTALDGLPPKLGKAMRNVAVTVDQDSTDLHLLGLYVGVPLTERTSQYSAVLPDRITIFRHAICAMCNTDDEVVEQVRRTVIHEVGHHFGIDDGRLHELGW
jgi:predicted Zn-dependent protease with MMP-like domain